MPTLTNSKLSHRFFLFLWKGRYRDAIIFGLLFLIFFAVQNWTGSSVTVSEPNPDNLQTNLLAERTVPVERVVDGDTFAYLNNGEEQKVRLLGVNTPETVDPRRTVECFGKEASAIAKEMLTGKSVRLVTDPTANSRDRYNRELRYVYLPDGTFLNRWLIENGYAQATPEYAFSFKQEFVNLEKEARMSEKGLWNPQACN
jgi:micrococcal nuclease